MKVNLLVDSDDVLGGYVNIDPFTKDGDTRKLKGNIHDLDEHVDDNELDELRAMEVFQFFAHIDSPVVADNWLKKIKHGGKLIIGIIDIMEVARALVNRDIDIDKANLLLYGNQKHPWTFHKSGFTAPQLIEYLESKHLKITRKLLTSDYRFIIEAQRK